MKIHCFTLLFLLFSFLYYAQTAPLGDNFGYTQGSIHATDGGASTYFIPFVSPAGTAELQPNQESCLIP